MQRNTDIVNEIKKVEQSIQAIDFSGVIAKYRGDKICYSLSSGYADRSEKRLNNSETLFATASGTKLFTALSIGILINEGKLTLDTPTLHIAPLPNPLLDTRMTVRHLLSHTSGFPDYLDENLEVNGEIKLSIPNYTLKSPSDYLPLFPLTKNTNIPGENFKYNNGAFVYLALMIEKLSSMSYAAFVRQRLLAPLGITRSGVYSLTALPNNTANGYYEDEGEWHTNIYKVPVQAGGDGGIFTTALEMKRLWEAFLNAEIFSANLVNEFLTPVCCVRPELGIHYGLGVWLKLLQDGSYEPYVVGSDVGVSFKSSYNKDLHTFFFVVSNTSEGVWQLLKSIT